MQHKKIAERSVSEANHNENFGNLFWPPLCEFRARTSHQNCFQTGKHIELELHIRQRPPDKGFFRLNNGTNTFRADNS